LPASDAFAALCRWLDGEAAPRRVLALGPLTNIAAIALARPDLAARISDLTWMGGGITSGNHTASAEFNAYADPEALAIVIAHGLPLRMVDLDLCRKVPATPDDVPPLRGAGGRNAAVLADMLQGYIDIAISRGRPAMAIYDPTAAAAFVRDDIVDFRAARIDVELGGTHTRGRTIVETRSHVTFNAHYAVDVRAGAARDLILGALLDEARR
jgi:purine nucleosidase